jgi:UDP-N-acetylmuramoyl-tripeptide--D-alanyl-D-alanine ligase
MTGAGHATALTLSEVARITSGQVVRGEPGRAVRGAAFDTRLLAPGNLFCALQGEGADGHTFLDKAAQKGAPGALISRSKDPAALDAPPELALVAVDDVMDALSTLAAEMRRQRTDVTVAAVTGSNGKTSTKEMLASIVTAHAGEVHVLRSRQSYNNLLGVSTTLMSVHPEHRFGVLELGMNAPGEIAQLTALATPDVGVITNVGPAHLEGLGSVENVARAKAELFEGLRPDAHAIIPEGEPVLAQAAAHLPEDHRHTFGRSADASVRVADAGPSENGKLAVRMKIGGRNVEATLNTLGAHNALNAAAAGAAAAAMGIPDPAIVAGLAKFRPAPHRLAVVRCGGALALDDCYNANPASMRAALETLATLPGGGPLGVLLGDMFELGDHSPTLHRELGESLAGHRIHTAVLAGPMMKHAADGAVAGGMESDRVHWTETTEEAGNLASTVFGEGYRVLVKGSRAMRLERALELWGCGTAEGN